MPEQVIRVRMGMCVAKLLYYRECKEFPGQQTASQL
jgi:hypothetical protein